MLQDKVIVITGAGSGIGEASARLCAEKGAKVVVSDLQLVHAERVASEIRHAGGDAIACKTDVTQYAEIEELVAQTLKSYGKIDVWVNNAGIGALAQNKTAEHSLEDWHSVIAVNQTGVFYGMKLALQQMLKQGGGNIINIASLAGIKASANNLSYSASKFAVVGMTKSAALEYASKKIRVNAICPGYTESPLLDQLISTRPDMEQILLKLIPMKRFGKVQDIAEAVVWLASDQTQFITGQALILDGGISL